MLRQSQTRGVLLPRRRAQHKQASARKQLIVTSLLQHSAGLRRGGGTALTLCRSARVLLSHRSGSVWPAIGARRGCSPLSSSSSVPKQRRRRTDPPTPTAGASQAQPLSRRGPASSPDGAAGGERGLTDGRTRRRIRAEAETVSPPADGARRDVM